MGKKAPKAPDPYATAQAQTQSNQQTAAYNQAMNLISQYTPYGNSVYTRTGTDASGAPTYRNDITLTPEAQQQLDNQLKQNNQLSNIGFSLADQAQASLAHQPTAGPLNYGASGGAIQRKVNDGNFNKQISDAENAVYNQGAAFLDPQYAQQQGDLNSDLANQGVTLGSNAYSRAQGDLGRQKALAYGQLSNQAIQQGQALQNQLYGQQLASANFANQAQAQAYGQSAQNAALNNSAQGQNLQQQAYLNSLPLNELNALRSGTQINNPSFQQTPSYTANPNNISGNIYQSYGQQSQNYNNQMNGLFGLGSTLLGLF